MISSTKGEMNMKRTALDTIIASSDPRFAHVGELDVFNYKAAEREISALEEADADDDATINKVVLNRKENIPFHHPSSYESIQDNTFSRAVSDFTIMHVDDDDRNMPIVQDLIERIGRVHRNATATTSLDKVDQIPPWETTHNTDIPNHVIRNVIAYKWITDDKAIDTRVLGTSIHDDNPTFRKHLLSKLNPVIIEYLHGKLENEPDNDDTNCLMKTIIDHVDAYTAFDAAIRSREHYGLPINDEIVSHVADRLLEAEKNFSSGEVSDLTASDNLRIRPDGIHDIEMSFITGKYRDEIKKTKRDDKHENVRKEATRRMLESSYVDIVNNAVELRRDQVDAKTWIKETWSHPNMITRKAVWYLFDVVPEMFNCTALETIAAVEKERGFADKQRHQKVLGRLRYQKKKLECSL